MSTPEHRTTPGSSYFVTTRCAQGRNVFQIPEVAQIVIAAMLHYRDTTAYLLHEFVVMPNHLDVLLTPGPTTSLEKAVQLIKGGSSYKIRKQRGHKMEIWQQGFHDWTIRDIDDWQIKAEYIRTNPVRAQLVEKPEDWLYSSAMGKFTLDPAPEKYLQLASAAKAASASTATSGLKPRPPKELQGPNELRSTRGSESPRDSQSPKGFHS
jgi:putative transposase